MCGINPLLCWYYDNQAFWDKYPDLKKIGMDMTYNHHIHGSGIVLDCLGGLGVKHLQSETKETND